MAKAKTTTTKIEILIPVAGKFLLSHNVGDKVDMESKQAEILIDEGYAKKI